MLNLALSVNSNALGVELISTVSFPYNDWAPLAYSFGARFFYSDLRNLLFTDKYAISTMEFVKKLHSDKLVYSGDPAVMPQTSQPFDDGKIGMVISDRLTYSAKVRDGSISIIVK